MAQSRLRGGIPQQRERTNIYLVASLSQSTADRQIQQPLTRKRSASALRHTMYVHVLNRTQQCHALISKSVEIDRY